MPNTSTNPLYRQTSSFRIELELPRTSSDQPHDISRFALVDESATVQGTEYILTLTTLPCSGLIFIVIMMAP